MKTDNENHSPQTDDTVVRIAVSRTQLVAVVVVVFGLGLFALLKFTGAPPSGPAVNENGTGAKTTSGSQAAGSGVTFRGSPGPWGQLEYVRINIERPDEFITVDVGPINDNRWFFEHLTESQITNLFHTAGLAPAELTWLLDKAHWQTVTNGIYIHPSQEVVMGMTPSARQKIYSVLSESPLNSFEHVPFSFRAGKFDEWFSQSGLTPATLEIVKKLLYQRGDSLCFSDLPEAFNAIPSRDERRRLIKTLSRHSTVLMKLQVRPDTDVESLVAYWGRGGRSKDIRPLLESLTKVPGGATLDAAHLLPSFARMRLYTFPIPSRDPDASHRDCFWTSMNFFNLQPDNRFFEFENTRKAIETDYTTAPGAPEYGDVVFLYNARGTIVHAAIYVADDVVFTKNGAHFNEPWLLMKIPDLLAVYPSETPLKMAVYRLKNT